MKKLQYLVSLVLLLGLGDESQVYFTSINSIVFLVSAFVFADEIERSNKLFQYSLMSIMTLFNPFYSAWLEVEQLRIVTYVLVSIFFLLKTSNSDLTFFRAKKGLKEAY